MEEGDNSDGDRGMAPSISVVLPAGGGGGLAAAAAAAAAKSARGEAEAGGGSGGSPSGKKKRVKRKRIRSARYAATARTLGSGGRRGLESARSANAIPLTTRDVARPGTLPTSTDTRKVAKKGDLSGVG